MSKIKILECNKNNIQVDDSELFFLLDYMNMNDNNYTKHFNTCKELFNKYFSVIFRFNSVESKEYKLTEFIDYLSLMKINNLSIDVMEHEIDIYFKDYMVYSVNEGFDNKFKNGEIQGFILIMIKTVLFLKHETDIKELSSNFNEYLFEKYYDGFLSRLNEIKVCKNNKDELENIDFELKQMQKGLYTFLRFLSKPEVRQEVNLYEFFPEEEIINVNVLSKIKDIEFLYNELRNIIEKEKDYEIFEELAQRFERKYFSNRNGYDLPHDAYKIYLQVKEIIPDFDFKREFTDDEKQLMDFNGVLFNTLDIYNKMKNEAL